MADILDAAQKQIDDAAQKLGSNPVGSPSPSVETSPPPTKNVTAAPPALEQQSATPPPPPEPPPPLPSAESANQPPAVSAQTPIKPSEPVDTSESNIVEALLKQTPQSATLPPPTTEIKASPPPPPKVRKTPKGVLLAVLLFLFATVPLSVFLVSQQRQLADLRSQATLPSYGACTAPDGRKGTCMNISSCNTETNTVESGCAQAPKAPPQVCCVPKQPPAADCGSSTKGLCGREGGCDLGQRCIGRTGPKGGVAYQCVTDNSCQSATGDCYTDCLSRGNTPSECRAACPGPTPTPTSKLKNDWEPCSRDSECKSGDCGKDPVDNTWTCLPKATPTPKLTPTPTPSGDCYKDCLSRGNTPSECRAACPGPTPTPTPFSVGGEICVSKGGVCRTPLPTDPPDKYCAKLGAQDCPADEVCVKLCPGTPTPTSKPPTPTPTKKQPTPTQPPVGPQCQNIKIYKNDVVVDPTTLQPGDNVVLAVAGANASKGRFRVNGAPSEFEETTGTNQQGEFTLPFIIPSGVTQFTIEAEVFRNGTWQ